MLRCIISHGGLKFHTSFGEVVGVVGQGVGQNTCIGATILGTVIFVAEMLIRGNLPDTLAENDNESRLPFVDLFARETNRVVHSIHSVNVSLAYEMVSKVMITALNSDRIAFSGQQNKPSPVTPSLPQHTDDIFLLLPPPPGVTIITFKMCSK